MSALQELDSLIPPEQSAPDKGSSPIALEELNNLIPGEAPSQAQDVAVQPDTSTASNIKALRPSFQMVGSMVGGAVGGAAPVVAGGPAGLAGTPAGIAVGGALGSAAGDLTYKLVEDVARDYFGVEGLGEQEKFSERIAEAGKEGVIDLGFTVGTQAVADVAKYAYKHMLTKETKELIEEADRLGIDPTKMVVHNTKLQRFYASVVGRFPFASGKFRTRAKAGVEQLVSAKENLFMRMGPSWDMAKVGIKLDSAYKTQFKVFRKIMNKKYSAVLDEAKRTGAYIRSDNIKNTSEEAIARMRLALQAQGESDEQIVKRLANDPVLNRLRKYVNVKETLTLDELRALDELLDKDLAYVSNRGGESIAQFGKIKDSFQEAKKTINQIQPPNEGGKTVKEMLSDADTQFTTVMTEMFETPTAKKVNTVNKNLFSVGKYTKAGTKNPDEAYKLLWNEKSPKGMEDLHRVVGDKRFGASLRTHMENLYDKSVQNGIDQYMSGQNKLAFDFQGFKNSLGIGNPKSIEYKTTEKALELAKSGVTMKDLTSFMALLENGLRNSPDDVNTFIARRATLGGPQAISSIVGTVGGISTLLLSRLGGRMLSGKPLIARASMMLDPNISLQHRKALALSFEKMLNQQEQ